MTFDQLTITEYWSRGGGGVLPIQLSI